MTKEKKEVIEKLKKEIKQLQKEIKERDKKFKINKTQFDNWVNKATTLQKELKTEKEDWFKILGVKSKIEAKKYISEINKEIDRIIQSNAEKDN